MKTTPRKFDLHADTLLSICAGLAAVLWMVLIFAVGMTLPAYLAAAAFVICAGISSLLRYRSVRDLPPEEKTPAPPLSFLRGRETAGSTCAACGAPLHKNDKFCAKCGKKVL
ncbi:MAG: zinc ribbon domain-containing protein [Butyricicoccus sp.]|nr:zinc ribbon domain-containing protein [Butyricicoccus sp.]